MTCVSLTVSTDGAVVELLPPAAGCFLAGAGVFCISPPVLGLACSMITPPQELLQALAEQL